MTTSKVYALTQKSAEKFMPSSISALISIATPPTPNMEYPQPDLSAWNAARAPVLQLSFHDTDPQKHGDGFIHMTDEDALQILAFAQANRGRQIYVHCWAGVSRSNAVARALHEIFGFGLGSAPSDQLANKHVWRLLMDNANTSGFLAKNPKEIS